jgi:CMP/dCMP kinase
MKLTRSGESFGTARIVERQMLLAKTREKAVRAGVAGKSALRYRYITISRDKGSLGDAIAQELSQRLGWAVYDKEILDYIAQDSHVRQSLAQQLDEKAQNLVHETIQRFLRMAEGGSFGVAEYHEALLKTLAYLSTRGEAILVGRGANFAMRGETTGLHIRIMASLKMRIQRLSLRWHIPPAEARWRMEEMDTERRNFIRHHFKQNIDDASYYDLVYNTDHLTPSQVVDSTLGVIQSSPQNATAAPITVNKAEASALDIHTA